MHIHVLGICGKFMCGLAIIAQQQGFKVTGSDKTLVPPIADMLRSHGIDVQEGYAENSLPIGVDQVIVGNALSRGVPIIEQILNENITYYSGPEWLLQHVLKDRWVLAVSGTHGKTTTTGMLTFILEKAGFEPGFLIGGNPVDFDASARYTESNFFVIEADEYDTAFFDKRSKFIHYHPRTLIFNNLEFDHADIFASLDDIKKQFCHLLRILPSHGLVIAPKDDWNVQNVLEKDCWTPIEYIGDQNAWFAKKIKDDGSDFEVYYQNKLLGQVTWSLVGDHNIANALASIAAARHVGIAPKVSIDALSLFQGVKRRLELKGAINNIRIYDDFAHHPTAIATTLSGLRAQVGQERIFAVLEFGSNTMREGFHEETIAAAFDKADGVIFLRPTTSNWQIDNVIKKFQRPIFLFDNVQQIVDHLVTECQSGDHILCMSNMMFDNIHQKLLLAFANAHNTCI